MYSQKILGSQLEYGLQGFGFYISRTAKDLDDNTFSGIYLFQHLYVICSFNE